MKKLILISAIFTLSLSANVDQNKTENISSKANLVKDYQEMFEKISQKRVGLEENEIVKVKQPFLTIKKKKTSSSKSGTKIATKKTNSLILEAIFNKRAMISGKWYSLYQSVGDKKIVSISDNHVWLKTVSGREKLTIRTNNANISIK